jgi:GNAT superfamily N-acetyltransferase
VRYEASNIRRALVQDAHSIAEVHVESSRTTYKDILPDSVLDSLSVEKRELSWKDLLTAPEPRSITLVGSDAGGRVAGFISGGRERTGRLGCDGELYTVYLLPSAQRQGLGTLLVGRFVHELKEQGFTSMAVWVLALNPFRKFYEALGGEVIGDQQIERGGESFTEIAYGWRDLNSFATVP